MVSKKIFFAALLVSIFVHLAFATIFSNLFKINNDLEPKLPIQVSLIENPPLKSISKIMKRDTRIKPFGLIKESKIALNQSKDPKFAIKDHELSILSTKEKVIANSKQEKHPAQLESIPTTFTGAFYDDSNSKEAQLIDSSFKETHSSKGKNLSVTSSMRNNNEAHLIPARPLRTISPKYPIISRRFGEEGRVVLLIEIRADGKARYLSTLKSSGYERLDRAAIKTLEKTDFEPAQKAGEPIFSEKKIAITFKLND